MCNLRLQQLWSIPFFNYVCSVELARKHFNYDVFFSIFDFYKSFWICVVSLSDKVFRKDHRGKKRTRNAKEEKKNQLNLQLIDWDATFIVSKKRAPFKKRFHTKIKCICCTYNGRWNCLKFDIYIQFLCALFLEMLTFSNGNDLYEIDLEMVNVFVYASTSLKWDVIPIGSILRTVEQYDEIDFDIFEHSHW